MHHVLHTKAEAAKCVRMSPRNFDRLLARGDGPTVTRISGRTLIRADHLTAWVESLAKPNARKE